MENYAFIVSKDETENPSRLPDFVSVINERYEIWFYNSNGLPPLNVETYTYRAIPKCYALLDTTALSVSGITKLQGQPNLQLAGEGVLMALIDTGINYELPVFRDDTGRCRVVSIWDQTKGEERASIPYVYGTVYTQEEIQKAVLSENPLLVVPERDENGHGTEMASIMCGAKNESQDFCGVAYKAEVIAIKLRPANETLKTYYGIPADKLVYAESDIMTGIAFAEEQAKLRKKPLVILLALGSNHGSHNGTSPLCDYLDMIGVQMQRAVAIASGNEAIEQHHFHGVLTERMTPERVEINVEKDMKGLWAELWTGAPSRVAVAVSGPGGELLPKGQPAYGQGGTYRFYREGTTLYIDYRQVGKTRQDSLVYMRFVNISKGIWTIWVYPQTEFDGDFDLWLPMANMTEARAFFLKPDPSITITSPSDAGVPMCVGGYNPFNDALYLDSGRGFTTLNSIKPDFVAPAVNISAVDANGRYVQVTGTSAGAAITAGACAQMLEWTAVDAEFITANSVDLKNYLIREARRSPEITYPSKEWGYGYLRVYL